MGSSDLSDFEKILEEKLGSLHKEGRYRVFTELERRCQKFPSAYYYRDPNPDKTQKITVWCSNDYLGMGQNKELLSVIHNSLDRYGAGAGGTRNISGTNRAHVELEKNLALLHKKESALIFTSGYVANLTSLLTLGSNIPEIIFYSDAHNHNSIIEGIRYSKAQKRIFRHNDAGDLEKKLAADASEAPKLVVFESVYSMDGDIAPVGALASIAKKHGAWVYLDEVHAVGMYGETGAGIAERENIMDNIDIIQGTLGKAYGLIGGYIAGTARLVDFVRSFGPGFIFTTSLPPALAAGGCFSVSWVRSHPELRTRHQERAGALRSRLRLAGLPLIESSSHIVPILICDSILCKKASDTLLQDFGIYAQPINYPTVPKGTERLRLTPTPLHTDELMDELVDALVQVWQKLGLDFVK